MKKIIFSFLCLIFSLSLYSQNSTIDNKSGLIGVINFDYDKSNLDNKDKAVLVSLINQFSKKDITINGFTDSDGDANYNQALSLRRANSVKHFLIKNGYPASKIIGINANGEVANGVKASNRKVEIYLDLETFNSPEIDTKIITAKKPVSEVIKVETKKKKAVPLKDEISNLEIGESLAIKNLNFKPGRHFLLPESEPTLKDLLQILKDNPTLKIEVQGHICCTTPDLDGRDNDTGTMNLSVNRAEYIYNYFINNGISPYRLSYKGFGASKPLVREITDEDRLKNRRVEIMVVEK